MIGKAVAIAQGHRDGGDDGGSMCSAVVNVSAEISEVNVSTIGGSPLKAKGIGVMARVESRRESSAHFRLREGSAHVDWKRKQYL